MGILLVDRSTLGVEVVGDRQAQFLGRTRKGAQFSDLGEGPHGDELVHVSIIY